MPVPDVGSWRTPGTLAAALPPWHFAGPLDASSRLCGAVAPPGTRTSRGALLQKMHFGESSRTILRRGRLWATSRQTFIPLPIISTLKSAPAHENRHAAWVRSTHLPRCCHCSGHHKVPRGSATFHLTCFQTKEVNLERHLLFRTVTGKQPLAILQRPPKPHLPEVVGHLFCMAPNQASGDGGPAGLTSLAA